jgi:hypothetical protein
VLVEDDLRHSIHVPGAAEVLNVHEVADDSTLDGHDDSHNDYKDPGELVVALDLRSANPILPNAARLTKILPALDASVTIFLII